VLIFGKTALLLVGLDHTIYKEKQNFKQEKFISCLSSWLYSI